MVAHYLPLYWTYVQARLAELERLAQQHGFRVIVMLIPGFVHPWDTYPFDDLYRRVREEMQSHGFAVVDLKPVFSAFRNEDLMLWGYDGHTSPFANRIIAEVLVDHLARLPAG
jgi:hypothetical protein